MAVATKK